MEIPVSQVLHYLGIRARPDDDLRRRIEDTARGLSEALSPRYVWRRFPLSLNEREVAVPQLSLSLPGQTARTMLGGCSSVVLLCCTLGGRFEALLRREQARDMAGAVILDACGSALVEVGCDKAQEEIRSRFPHLFLTDRFSPGYGDLPLSLQSPLCSALDARRRLGVEVTDHSLLNPGKSVTALIGLSDTPQMARIRGCDFCSLRENCTLRKGGTPCVL